MGEMKASCNKTYALACGTRCLVWGTFQLSAPRVPAQHGPNIARGRYGRVGASIPYRGVQALR
eukprot:2678479-Pyramimonas_sp.AAC.1